MRKPQLLLLSILMVFLVVSGCSTKDQTEQKTPGIGDQQIEITVSAAASLQNALNEIKADFEKDHPNVKINYNFGGSGALEQQILQGAPVDLFFSAAEDKFDGLVQKGIIEKQKGMNLVGNELVLVTLKNPAKAIKNFNDLPKADKISIGTPESVPAGQYAKETLAKLHIWNAVAGKIVYAKDVRQVLTYVETGNVDAGIVYKTDAFVSPKVKIIATAEETTHTPIVYPVGVIKNSTHLKEAQLFYDYLHGKKSLQILRKYGFKSLIP